LEELNVELLVVEGWFSTIPAVFTLILGFVFLLLFFFPVVSSARQPTLVRMRDVGIFYFFPFLSHQLPVGDPFPIHNFVSPHLLCLLHTLTLFDLRHGESLVGDPKTIVVFGK
jgi:hypothetical protein